MKKIAWAVAAGMLSVPVALAQAPAPDRKAAVKQAPAKKEMKPAKVSKSASPATGSPTFVCTDPSECQGTATVHMAGGECVIQVFPEHMGLKKGNRNVKVRLRLENSPGWEFTADGQTFKDDAKGVFTLVSKSKKHFLWKDANAAPGTYRYKVQVVRLSDNQVCESDPSYVNDSVVPE